MLGKVIGHAFTYKSYCSEFPRLSHREVNYSEFPHLSHFLNSGIV